MYFKPIKGPDGNYYLSAKILRGPDGEKHLIGVERITGTRAKDLIYAERFWEKQPPGMLEVMTENLRTTAKLGWFGYFVSPSGIGESDKARLSAYREHARGMGYEIGEFTFNSNSYIAKAPMKKIETD